MEYRTLQRPIGGYFLNYGLEIFQKKDSWTLCKMDSAIPHFQKKLNTAPGSFYRYAAVSP